MTDAPTLTYDRDTSIVARLRAGFDSGRTRDLAWRQAQLDGMRRMLIEQEQTLLDALRSDLRKHPVESWMTEIGSVLGEIRHARKNLRRWAAPRRVHTALMAMPGRSRILPEPLGVVLNISAWNYPLQEGLVPMVGALAAGNCVLLKPSELGPASARALGELLPRYLDPDCVGVYQGGPDETGALLKERFDHILYTGGGHVGRIVARAAAEHLTPVTLELGGKSPAIVDRNTNIALTARRIAWGKWQNAGQICISPDYVLVHEAVRDDLVAALKTEIAAMYGPDPQASESYGRIVNARHFDRLTGYLDGQTILHGGQHDRDELFIAPTLLDAPDPTAPVMQEEIFGPLLPVLSYSDPQEAMRFVTARDKPLALYLFSNDTTFTDAMLGGISAGQVCVNDTLMFMACPALPFGGVGASGTGNYSGKFGFDTFSHLKPVLRRFWAFDISLRYAPYTARKGRLLRMAGR